MDKKNALIDENLEAVVAGQGTLERPANRLEHTVANVDNQAENQQTSESRIRDIDITKTQPIEARMG